MDPLGLLVPREHRGEATRNNDSLATQQDFNIPHRSLEEASNLREPQTTAHAQTLKIVEKELVKTPYIKRKRALDPAPSPKP